MNCNFYSKIETSLPSAAAELRHKVFVDKLKWIQGSKQTESDKYDAYAKHFIVMSNERLVGYLRVIPGGMNSEFMLEDDFSILNPFEKNINISTSLEVSRLCTDDSLSGIERTGAALLLYKASYLWAIQNNLNFWHVVVTEQYFRALRRIGFPFTMVSSTKEFDAMHKTIYATLDLFQAQKVLSSNNPELYEWVTGQKS